MRTTARRLSSDWESTRLKIELSPVQIREAAFSYELCGRSDRTVSGEIIPDRIRSGPERRRGAIVSVTAQIRQVPFRTPTLGGPML